MVYFYTGTPGSGKSLHMAEVIYDSILAGKNVIANFEVNESYFDKCRHPEKLGKFIYVQNYDWQYNAYTNRTYVDPDTGRTVRGHVPDRKYTYIDGLFNYAMMYHKRDRKGNIVEHQTILVLDECQHMFNNRDWRRKDRMEWVYFFREHRKYGYDVYLISQDDECIDKQIRSVFQYKVNHKSVANYKTAGKLLALLHGGTYFVWTMSNYQMRGKDAYLCHEYFTGRKFFEFYNSYQTFNMG